MWKDLPINIKQRLRSPTGQSLPGRKVSERGFYMRGMREYEAGDSFRSLSRKHYMRTGDDLVIEKLPERDAFIVILFDVSRSERVGGAREKYDAQLELLHHFGWACLWQGHKIQVLAFAETVELESAVIRQPASLNDIIDRLAELRPQGKGTGHESVFEHAALIAGRVVQPADLVCILSDFLFPLPRQSMFKDLEDLRDLADVIVLAVRDRVEDDMPMLPGTLQVRDAESGRIFWAGAASGYDPLAEIDRYDIDSCVFLTSENSDQWFEALSDFFIARRMR